jgi:hypothetical protein
MHRFFVDISDPKIYVGYFCNFEETALNEGNNCLLGENSPTLVALSGTEELDL